MGNCNILKIKSKGGGQNMGNEATRQNRRTETRLHIFLAFATSYPF
jgi:hypothetical protein